MRLQFTALDVELDTCRFGNSFVFVSFDRVHGHYMQGFNYYKEIIIFYLEERYSVISDSLTNEKH